ncbi:hypothetical protein PYW07_003970 [Mythimna separata]|uniref:O-acyltransferase n=1 Tax=Mythimna separata TaxID=271217 RepID=A0AAD8DTV5_MYTSE|nr:hypothetical protein PYW07_003970 [Mythimna separata]
MIKMTETGVHNHLMKMEQNGEAIHEEEKKEYEEFTIRESPLTTLLDTINIGLSVVVAGFGDIRRGFALWVYEFFVSMSLYPLLIVYSWIGTISRKNPALRPTVVTLGVAGVLALEVALVAVPVFELTRKRLEIASATTVTCEMFRFMMKLVAIASACGPRCLNGNKPLPTFKQFIYFMFAPTLLYRDQYPRTKKIRWGVVVFHLLEIAAIIFYNTFVWERFLKPHWFDYGKSKTVEVGAIVRGIYACVLPGLFSWTCGFYCTMHAWLNACAEVLKFGDRQFYKDWWTKSRFSEYYRNWNRVVHLWFRDHIYLPLVPYVGRPLATFTIFFVSALAHEIIISLCLGFFYPVLLVEFGVLGVLMIPVSATAGRRFPNFFNVILWSSFFIGNGMLWSFYPMEFFARRNCPPSENDSFFIPKSWTCPEVILKPNWTFQNPLRIF